MESDHQSMEMGGSSSAGGGQVNSRWNPTKEQIIMLESLYSQGIRTPSAEQIQQITNKLKAYGHIEGKNVFYWFQNHKARQRQKQKQESMAYLTHYLHNKSHPSLFPPPCPNVVCGPYYIPQSDLGFYPPYPKVLLPTGAFKRRQRSSEKMCEMTLRNHRMSHEHDGVLTQTRDHHLANHFSNAGIHQDKSDVDDDDQETLDLFPLHPTGILRERATSLMSPFGSADNSNLMNTTSCCSSSETACSHLDEGFGDKLTFFDFFTGQGLCENLH